MTQTTTTTVHDARGAAPPTPPARSAAHRLVVWGSVTAVAADVVLMGIIAELIPPLVVIGLLTIVVAALSSRRPRGAAIALGVLAVVALLGSAPFLAADLSNPTDTIAFVYGVLSGGGRLLAIIGLVLARRGSEAAVRPLVAVALSLLTLAVAGSVVARATVSSDDGVAGDVAVTVSGFEFPDRVAVSSGGALLVDNRDVVRHSFTVEGTDLDVMVEPRVQRRVEVDLAPGTYEIVCTVPGHESMTGMLEVE